MFQDSCLLHPVVQGACVYKNFISNNYVSLSGHSDQLGMFGTV